MWPLLDKIFSHKPQTVAGLAVLARASTLYHSELWDDGVEEDGKHREFLETACAFLGVNPVPEEVQS
jgi:hypothetical protein